MPLHRLWDMVDAEPGLFDTIIVDEASQANGDALALLLLAKRIIVVGDDTQNSPEAVGVPEDSIARLAREHLKQFRFRDEFRPDTSLFDHAERSFGEAAAHQKLLDGQVWIRRPGFRERERFQLHDAPADNRVVRRCTDEDDRAQPEQGIQVGHDRFDDRQAVKGGSCPHARRVGNSRTGRFMSVLPHADPGETSIEAATRPLLPPRSTRHRREASQ